MLFVLKKKLWKLVNKVPYENIGKSNMPGVWKDQSLIDRWHEEKAKLEHEGEGN